MSAPLQSTSPTQRVTSVDPQHHRHGHKHRPRLSEPCGPAERRSLYAQQTANNQSSPGFTGTVVLQGYAATPGGSGAALSLYAQPATYTINSVTLTDNVGIQTAITIPTAIAKLFGNKTTITVKN